MKRKEGFIWYFLGAVFLNAGIAVALLGMRKLFLPTASEIVSALILPLILTVVGVGFVIAGKVLPQREASETAKKAKLVADGYNTQAFSYESAYEAIEARIVAWENTHWEGRLKDLKPSILSTLCTINRGVADLGKMSLWFNTSLSGPLYDAAREAVGKVDASKLKFLSGFISYCASVTEYELLGDYFTNACTNADKEIKGALDLYASMRAKLNSYSGDPSDIARLKEEMKQITGLF